MDKDIEKILMTESDVAQLTRQLGERISRDYNGKDILAVIVLKGAVIFAADLVRAIHGNVTLDFMQASSYGSKTVSGGLKIVRDTEQDVKGKNVLIIEDIIDSGNTLERIKGLLLDRGANDVKICTLLSKPARRETDVAVEYIGEEIPDEFVVGCGLDFDEKYRNLPYIGILKREVYSD